jgi:hypothetical protein
MGCTLPQQGQQDNRVDIELLAAISKIVRWSRLALAPMETLPKWRARNDSNVRPSDS